MAIRGRRSDLVRDPPYGAGATNAVSHTTERIASTSPVATKISRTRTSALDETRYPIRSGPCRETPAFSTARAPEWRRQLPSFARPAGKSPGLEGGRERLIALCLRSPPVPTAQASSRPSGRCGIVRRARASPRVPPRRRSSVPATDGFERRLGLADDVVGRAVSAGVSPRGSGRSRGGSRRAPWGPRGRRGVRRR
jgi:hypothetical protein